MKTLRFMMIFLLLIQNLLAFDSNESSKNSNLFSQDQKDLNNSKVIIGFSENVDSKKVGKFFFLYKKSISRNAPPKYIHIQKEYSDLGLLDFVSRRELLKPINELTISEMDNFFSKKGLDKKDGEDAKIILELSELTSEDLITESLKYKTKNFSYQRKLELLSSIGLNLYSGYDLLRTDKSNERSNGIISIEDLFGALKSSLDSGLRVKMGVCRDMHLAMAKMASAMGIKNVYGVTFDNRYDIGHMILSTTPDKYGMVSLINYNKIYNISDQAGVSNLETFEDLTSFGLSFGIVNSETSKEVLKIPSRLADALIKISGASSDDYFFSNQTDKDFSKIGIKTKFGDLYFANYKFLGQKPGQVSGVFYQLNKNFSFLKIDGAIGYIDSERLNADEKLNVVNLQENGLYLRSKINLNHDINLKNGFKFKVNVSHNISFLYSCRKSSDKQVCAQDDKDIPADYRNVGKDNLSSTIAGFGFELVKNNFKSNLNYEVNLQMLRQDERFKETKLYLGIGQHKISSNVEFNFKKFNIVGFGALIFTDLENQMVKTYTVGSKILYMPLGISFIGQKSGRIENQDQVVPIWIPGTENITLLRLLYNNLKLQGQLGVEAQLSNDFPQYNTGFIIFNIEH